MALELYRFGEHSDFHAEGSAAALGICTWHGPDSCSEPARWSFVWRRNPDDGDTARESACDRGLEDAMLRGYLVGQHIPRAPVRGRHASTAEKATA
jgi:hypothetical protein